MYRQILVPVDGSETAADGLREAVKVARAFGGRLRLVHVVNEFIIDGTYRAGMYSTDLFQSLRDTGRAILDQAESQVRCSGVEVESLLLESIGSPAADVIVAQARQWPAELVVMGTHGRRGLARLALGSDAEQVVRMLSVPVLLVRSAAHRARTVREPAAVQAPAGVTG